MYKDKAYFTKQLTKPITYKYELGPQNLHME